MSALAPKKSEQKTYVIHVKINKDEGVVVQV